MTSPLLLDDFDVSLPRPDSPTQSKITEAELEKARLSSYEAGYSAGWEDAIREAEETGQRIDAEFARNLEDMSFTFHEARSHMLANLEPLLMALTDTFLPEILKDALGEIINEEMLQLAGRLADTPLAIRLSPENRDTMERLLAQVNSAPVKILEDDVLPSGQVRLEGGVEERIIDLADALTRVKCAIAALYEINGKAAENG